MLYFYNQNQYDNFMQKLKNYFVKCLLAHIFSFVFTHSNGQIVTMSPTFATSNDNNVVLTYDASKGTAGLLGESTIYAHTGVITDKSTSSSDWKYVIAGWTTNLPKALLTRIGTTNQYALNIGNIRNFYAVPAGEKILKLAMVFRNASSAKEGKGVGGTDIFVDVNQGTFQVKILTPTKATYFLSSDNVSISAFSSTKCNLTLYANGNQLNSLSNDSTISYSGLMSNIGTGKVQLVLKGTSGSFSAYDTTYIVNRPGGNVSNPPSGIVDGINYINDNTVTLMLYAPNKNFVFVYGDFNNWELDPTYMMNRTPDGSRYWITLNGLQKGVEYAFQYVIDNEKLKVADIYSDKILDPFNDKWINQNNVITYPNLKPFPEGKTTDPVSIIQTGQTPYNWQFSNYNKLRSDRLVIYELLLRDFLATHDFKTLTDTIDYLKNLGVNCIELMPVNEFDGNESWGYNPNFYFAVDKYYGTKDDYKRFIDVCHSKGIMVVMDIVLNQSWGLNPQVKMYWDAANNRPAANNPWFNPVPTHPFSPGYDYNHESQATKDFVDRVIKYWVTEYKIDGYRFDLSKGFTQKNTGSDVAAWGVYDQSRVNIWNRIRTEFVKTCPDCYMILEHLGENSEEKVLANAGFLLWGKMTEQYNQITMGYSTNSDISSGNYKNRQFTFPNLVTYAESHDEERLMYKNLTFGNGAAKDLNTALKRTEAAMAMLIPLKGPKMLWQFEELGFDKSIFSCGDGTVPTPYGTDRCKTDKKAPTWNYQSIPARKNLYNAISKLTALKRYSTMESDNYSYDAAGTGKFLKVTGDTMNVIIAANFDMNSLNIKPQFQNNGWWYDYMTGDSINVTSADYNIALSAGDYKVYTSKNLNKNVIIDNLNIDNSTLFLKSTAVDTSINITSNRSWVISNTNSWVTINPMLGSGNTKLGISLAANTTAVSRTANINIQAGSVYKQLQINQLGFSGIDDIEKEVFEIYPNPSNNGKLSVRLLEKNNSPFKLAVYDIVGKEIAVFENEKLYIGGGEIIELDLSSSVKSKSGMYFIKAFYQDGSCTKKILIQ